MYIIEVLSSNSRVPDAHRLELCIGTGGPQSAYTAADRSKPLTITAAENGCGKHVTHAVVKTDAHPLYRIVCYAARDDALRIADALNRVGISDALNRVGTN